MYFEINYDVALLVIASAVFEKLVDRDDIEQNTAGSGTGSYGKGMALFKFKTSLDHFLLALTKEKSNVQYQAICSSERKKGNEKLALLPFFTSVNPVKCQLL